MHAQATSGDASRRGWAFGWYIAATILGSAASLYLSRPVIAFGVWRSAFYATACGPIVGTLLMMRVVQYTPNVAEPLTPGVAARNVWSAVFRNKSALLAILGYTSHSWELLGMRAWRPTFLAISLARGTVTGAQAARVGASLGALMTATSMLGNISAGALSDRWGRTAVALGFSALSVACSFSIGWCVALPFWLIVVLGVL
jgi:MFS family permease